MSLRISLVQYLNAAPLGWYFLHGPLRRNYQVCASTPAKCAEQLARGEVDVGILPSIEYQRIPDLHVIPEISIAAVNEVRSVLLVRPREGGQRSVPETMPPGTARVPRASFLGHDSNSRTAHGLAGGTPAVPEGGIRSVALDMSSRTSVVLLKLLLQHKMGLHPDYVPCEPDVGKMLQRCDAALIIGDAALRCSSNEYDITDLAAEWRDWQSKPFVFAFWACRDNALAIPDLAYTFLKARDWGLNRIEEIAASYARTLQLPAAFLEQYLRRNLDHTMGPEHVEGLERFYRLAFEAGWVEGLAPLRFVPQSVT